MSVQLTGDWQSPGRDTGEAIEVLSLPLDMAQAFMDDHSLYKSAGLLFGLLWLRTLKSSVAAS